MSKLHRKLRSALRRLRRGRRGRPASRRGHRGRPASRRARRRRPRSWRRRLPDRFRATVGAAGTLLIAGSLYGGVRLVGGALASGETTEASHLPALPVISPRFEGVPLSQLLQPPAVSREHMDELLSSDVLRDPDFTREVHRWVGYWTGPATEWFPGFLSRMASLGGEVDAELNARGLPPSLRYLPLIESGYDPRVTSRAAAVGLWQLMPSTAGDLGLEISPLLDERRNPEKSTTAALTFLGELRDRFGSWHLALAAYNSGPTRVRSILRRHAPGVAGSDSLYWALRDRFPRETREFVPKLYAAMWVASHPSAYGYTVPTDEQRSFEVVRVDHQTTLDIVALAAGTTHDEVVRLNPEFLRGITPDGRSVVRVPVGSARAFRRIFPRVRPQDRVNFARHVVEDGETLGRIAARYGLALEEIEAVNPHVDPVRLRVGGRVVLPIPPGAETEPES